MTILQFLAASAIATELLERTANTPDVLRAVQLSLAPAFLLVGIGSILNVMVNRLTWIAGRIERLMEQSEEGRSDHQRAQLEWLRKRRRRVRSAIEFSTAAAVVISVVVAVLFVSAYIEPRIGTLVAVLWVFTMILLIMGLVQFLRETLLASRGPGDMGR